MLESLINYEYIGHIAYTVGLLSFMLKDILWLRLITIVSACLCIVYNYAAPLEPMWVPIYWNLALAGVNIFQIAVIFHGRRTVIFDEKEKWLYTNVFPNFTAVDFKRLMKSASWNSSSPGETLIMEGQSDCNLMLITNGKCAVELAEGPVAELLNGDFIGEMSFLSGKAASANVKAAEKIDYIVWDRAELTSLFNKSPVIYNEMKSVISNQLTEKIIKTTKSKNEVKISR